MTKGHPKVIKTREELGVAERYFVYKLYETTDGQPMQWQLLGVSHCSQARRRLRDQLSEPEEPPVARLVGPRASLRRSADNLLRARQEHAEGRRSVALIRARRQATLLLRRDLAAMGRRWRQQQEDAQHRRPHAILDHDD